MQRADLLTPLVLWGQKALEGREADPGGGLGKCSQPQWDVWSPRLAFFSLRFTEGVLADHTRKNALNKVCVAIYHIRLIFPNN